MADEIRAQPGPQSEFLASSADIAIYGGEAGGGKSFALLLEPLYDYDNPKFGGVIFRRTSPQLVGAGSLWENANDLYRPLGARLTESPNLNVEFPSGATLEFRHLQRANDVYDHQGKEYALVAFDELTHFEASQFWYLVSRMRSTSGARVRMRGTCNPDPDSFVRKLISWWIGDALCGHCRAGSCKLEEHGYPIPERSGVLRWFVRQGESILWSSSPEKLLPHCRPGQKPMSLTFIHAGLKDNPALTSKDPGYEARINALPEVDRLRLGKGNWNARQASGRYIKPAYFARRWEGCPPGCDVNHKHQPLPPLNIYAASDYAVTEEDEIEGNDPDYTEHGIIGVSPNDDWYVLDWWSGREGADVWIDALLDKYLRWKPIKVFGESGVIRRAVEPFMRKRMLERKCYFAAEWINAPRAEKSATKQGYKDRSKRAKAIKGRSFQGRAAMGKVLFPAHAEWADRVIQQCVGFPVGHDDAFDVLALFGLAVDQAHAATPPRDGTRPPEDRWNKAFNRTRGDGEGFKTA